MIDKNECQEKILNLLISYADLINELNIHKIDEDYFDPKYRCLYKAICVSRIQNISLTAINYEDFVEKSVASGAYEKFNGSKLSSIQAKISESNLFFQITSLSISDKNDFAVYLDNLKTAKIKEQVESLFNSFAKEAKGDYIKSVKDFSDGLSRVSSLTNSEAASWSYLKSYITDYQKELLDLKNNPKKKLSTGISEIDESLVVGLEPGSLILFVADVGGYKSTLMMNIGLNILKQSQENVLYVSLEMPKRMLTNKIVARECNIKLTSLSNPEKLTEVDLNKIEDEKNRLDSINSNLAIIEATESMSTSQIRAQIEQHISLFKPRIVVIDYITILGPEKWYAKQQPHAWVGYMCKALRQMGNKYGFCTISAAQLGRDAIKRLRTQKEGAQSVGSEDLRGSHDFSADADAIYALVPMPNQPNQKLQVFCIKSRYGSKTFGGANRAILDIKPEIGLITGAVDASWNCGSINDDIDIKRIQEKNEKLSFDLDLDDNLDLDSDEKDIITSFAKEELGPKSPPKTLKKKISVDDLMMD